MGENRQCPRCGALLVADATWCPQCFLNFRRVFRPRVAVPPPPPRPDVARVADLVETARADGRAAVAAEPPRAPAGWPCPTCGFLNPLERNVCEVCTTPFSRLFEGARPVRRSDPKRAGIASLIFPGLGHADAGRIAEGLARAVLFLWSLATGIALAMFHAPTSAGPLGPLAGLFFAAAAAVYVLSAVDARRAASGEDQLLSPRVLLYGSAGLVLLTVASLFVLVLHTTSAAHAFTHH